jgi:hypothetical protein
VGLGLVASVLCSLAYLAWTRRDLSGPPSWGSDLRVERTWAPALERVHRERKLLLVVDMWPESVACSACDGLRATLRAAAAGEGPFALLARMLREDFVCLEFSPAADASPAGWRGPEAPWGYDVRRAQRPVLIVKDAEGRTLARRNGWFATEAGHRDFPAARRLLETFLTGAREAAEAPRVPR